MSHMERPAAKQPAMPYPTTSDGKFKYTTADGRPLHFPPTELPDFFEAPILPAWLTSRLKRLLKRAPKVA